jgi:hypothetical protein
MIPQTLNTFSLNLDWLHRLIADLDDTQMVCQPAGIANHPAWTIGHLAQSCEQIGGEIGIAPWLSADWAERFGTGSKPVANRISYPTKSVLLRSLDDGFRKLSERLTAMTPADLEDPLPDVRYRRVFPTIGHAVLHILTSHTAVHVGQIIVWRRAMGLPAIPEMLV